MITIVVVSDETAEGKTTLCIWLRELLKSHDVEVRHLNKRNLISGKCNDYTSINYKLPKEFPLEVDQLEIEIIDIDGNNGPKVRELIGIKENWE